MKLELKHLAGYLPYGLGIYSETYGIKSIMTISGNGGDNPSDSIESVLSGKFKPLLRPLSSLVKEIEVNGERFVPIVELAKLAFFKTEGAELCGNFARLEDGYSFHFSNNTDGVCFSCRKGYDGKRWDYNCFVPNQLVLFQKLYEWHFDIYGLIDKGLAIAIED
jgi:hypothetical protein